MIIRHYFSKFSDFLPFQFVVLLLAMMSVVACDQQGPTETTISHPQNSVIKLRLGHDMPTSSAIHEGAIHFASLVKEKSKGQITVEVFPAQVLGNDHQMIAMAQSGELDIILPPTAKLSTLVPELQIFDLPFLFSTTRNAHLVLDGEVGKQLLALFEPHGLVGASFWASGFKQLTTNQSLDAKGDLKGMTFRIMRSEVISDQFKAWGAKPLAVAFGKTHGALSENIVDGQENPLGSIYSMKFHEVQSHLYLSNHGYLSQVLSFSKKTFTTLSEKHRKLLQEAAVEAAIFQRRRAQEIEGHIIEEIKQSNIIVSELPSQLKKHLQEESNGVVEKHRLTVGSGLIELARQKIDETRVYSDDELVIGLDADMAGISALSGLSIRRGIELAMEEINHAGGVLGKKLVLTARDNSMVSARGIDNIERFSKIPNLIAVVGGISSPVALSELDIIHEKKIIYLDPWAAATPIVSNGRDPNFVFRVSVRDEYAAGFLLPKALNISNKVGLLLVNNGWGRSNHLALIDALKARNLDATVTEWFNWGESNHPLMIDNLYQRGVEVIIYVGNSVEAAEFVRQLAKHASPIPVISHWGITGGTFEKMAGDALTKIDLRVLQMFSFINNDDKRAQAVAARYREKYKVDSNQGIVAPVGTAHAYDLIHLLALAIKQAGSIDPDAVRLALENINFHAGLVRSYKPPFTKDHHDALDRSDFFLSRYDNSVLVPLGE